MLQRLITSFPRLQISQPPFANISWEIVVLRPDIFPAPLYTYRNAVIDLDDSSEDPPEDATEKAWACYNSDRFLRSCQPTTGHARKLPFKHSTLRPPRDRPSPLAMIMQAHNALKAWTNNRDSGFCVDATTAQTGFKREDLPEEGPQVNARELEDLVEEMRELVELIIPQTVPSLLGLSATASSPKPLPTSTATLEFWNRVVLPLGGSVEAATAPGAPSLSLGQAPPAYKEKPGPLLPARPNALDSQEVDSIRLNNQLFEKETRRALHLLDQHCFISGDALVDLQLWNIVDRYPGHASMTRNTVCPLL